MFAVGDSTLACFLFAYAPVGTPLPPVSEQWSQMAEGARIFVPVGVTMTINIEYIDYGVRAASPGYVAFNPPAEIARKQEDGSRRIIYGRKYEKRKGVYEHQPVVGEAGTYYQFALELKRNPVALHTAIDQSVHGFTD